MVTRIAVQNLADHAPPELAASPPVEEPMSHVDRAWLRMDSRMNLMMIVGVWIIKPGVSLQAVRQRLGERLLCYPRFGQYVQEEATGASWVTDEDFKIERHVVPEKLPRTAKGGEQQALQDRLAELAMQPLNRRHPLWQFHLVEHYQGGSALMARIHHCIADGIALIAVTHSLMDGGAVPPQGPLPVWERDGIDGVEDWLADTFLKPITSVAVNVLDSAGDRAVSAMAFMSDPNRGVKRLMKAGQSGVVALAKMAFQATRDGAALALMADDDHTRLKGIPRGVKRVAWCEPIPLDEVKAVARALNCSINDILLSCVAGALGEYLKALGDEVAGKNIRAMVPVNLRPIEEAYKLGNQFGLAPVVLPIGIEHPLERVYEVRRRMAKMKGSLQPAMTLGLLAVAGLLIKPGQDALLKLFSQKTTAVMTNVPGPREKLKFCGSTLEQDLVWVPQSGTVGLGVSILSYGGGVQFGVISDVKLCPQPQQIIDKFEPEFSKLALLTLMLPWED